MAPVGLVSPLPDLDVDDPPAAPSTAKEWVERRANFRHNWLKNTFLFALRAFLERLENDPQSSSKRVREFINDQLATWPKRSAEVHVLVESYADCLSPSVLLDREPLRRMEEASRSYLADLIDALWEARTEYDQVVKESLKALSMVDETYEQIAGDLDGSMSVDELASLHPLFLKLRDASSELSASLDNYENKIQVT
jgi:hypothetical protein